MILIESNFVSSQLDCCLITLKMIGATYKLTQDWEYQSPALEVPFNCLFSILNLVWAL